MARFARRAVPALAAGLFAATPAAALKQAGF
jgi:hypothetical protein